MAKVVVRNKCNAPTLKQLPEEFTEQISTESVEARVVEELLKASLPQLAKRVNSDNYYAGSAIKAVNLASSLHEKIENHTKHWNRFNSTELSTEFCNRGVNTDWQIQHEDGRIEAMHISELYSDVEVEVHVIVKRTRKSKEWLAGKGVK